MEQLFESIAQQLLSRHIAVEDRVLEGNVLDALLREALGEYEEGRFREAGVGKGPERQRISEIRGDEVRWLGRENATAAQAAYWTFLDGLRTYLSEFFRIHLERTELHFAIYPKGAFYTRHLDQFRDFSNRIFSVILYLNPDWKPGDGGELRVYHNGESHTDFAPLHGRLVCFRSDTVEHEVLGTVKTRVSLTGWMRRDKLVL